MDVVRHDSSMSRRLTTGLAAFVLSTLACGSAQANINIAQSPLFVLSPVPPALLLAVDDSGSMDAEILLRSNDGAAWWHTGDRSFTGRNQSDALQPGIINFNINGGASGTWKKFIYLFPNGAGGATSGERQYNDGTNDHFAVPPIGAFGYVRSPEFNYAYFDPAGSYDPWPDLGGYVFADADPTAAKTDPTRGTRVFDLTVAREQTGANHTFRVFDGMVIPAGTRVHDGAAWATLGSDTTVTGAGGSGSGLAISYFPATFYLSVNTPLPDGYGYDPDKMVGGADVVIDGSAPDGAPLVRYEIRPENFVTTEAYQAAIQSFANWFTYYRKRHAASRGAMGVAFKNLEGFRVGSYLINNRVNVTMRDLSNATQRDAFFYEIYRNYLTSGGGTPNKEAVNHMRGQFARTGAGAPIVESCQMNFGVLFTDGYSNQWTGAGVGNKDGTMGVPFADGVSNTMADIAAALYLDNPRPDLPTGEVPVPVACSGTSPHPSLDCNRDLHVNLFGVTLGAPGTIFNVDLAATADPYSNPPTWPTSFPVRNPVGVDDLWHATLNSRGVLLDVNIPAELGVRFAEILAAIGARVETSATSAATSSAVLQTDTLLYTAGFRSVDWSGRLDARLVNSDGTLGALAWDAEDKLAAKGPVARKIFTRRADGTAVAFEFDNLSVSQKEALHHASDGSYDGLGEERVEWLRGSESAHLSFRNRSSTGKARLLGDIVNSNPKFEDGVLYVGANDGMLHAFDAETGEELFAYIPSILLQPESGEDFAPLSRLPDADYVHRYFVDGTAAVVNLESVGVAQTVLVGSLGAGGRTIYALDVTNPATFGTADVLWEFTHPELGYNVGQPAIVRISDGTMAAVFGNGYNSDSQRAMLFVVNLDNGALIAAIDTGVGSAGAPNGLAAPSITDWPVSNLRANRVYAGDLQGNLWRFNIGGGTATWSNPGNVEVLFNAVDEFGSPQPITVPPVVALNPANANEIVVAFGTGSYFRTQDQDMPGAPVQSLYGILDTKLGSTTVTRAQLLEQTVESQTVETFGGEAVRVRTASDNPLNPLIHKGWHMDLKLPNAEDGERVITDATFPSGPLQRRVRFTTLIPDSNPCGSGRRGFLMDLDLVSGGRTAYSVFDLNRDGEYNDDDMVGGVPVSGVAWGQGERPTLLTPGNSSGDPPEFLYTGEGEHIRGLGEEGLGGRQSWQQLR